MDHRRVRAWLAAISIGTLVGCAENDVEGTSTGFSIRDSAGITIATDGSPDRPLEMQEVLRIGVVTGDPNYEFELVYDLAVDDNGGIWVSDGPPPVRYFDSEGLFQREISSVGDGPGETEFVSSITLSPQTLLLTGSPNLLQFSFDGELLYQRSFFLPSRDLLLPMGHVEDDWIFEIRLSLGNTTIPATGVPFRTQSSWAKGSIETNLLAPSLTLPGEANVATTLNNGAISLRSDSYFMGNPRTATTSSGAVLRSDPASYEIKKFDLDGRVLQIMRRSIPPVLYDLAWIDQGMGYLNETEIVAGGETIRLSPREIGEARERLTPSTAPDFLPFVEEIFATPSGETWIRRGDRHPNPGIRAIATWFGYTRPIWPPEWSGPQVFDLLDPEGRYLGTATLPDRFIAMAATADRIYGSLKDDLDVSYVVAYEIMP